MKNPNRPIILINGYDTTSNSGLMNYVKNDDMLNIEILKINIANHISQEQKIHNPWIIYILNNIDKELYMKTLFCKRNNNDTIIINILANTISSQLSLCNIPHSCVLLTEFIANNIY